MEFDIFFSISQTPDHNGYTPTEREMFANYYSQLTAADRLGFGVAWVAQAHLSTQTCFTTSQPQMVNVAFNTLSVEIRSMLMNEVDENIGGETQTLVYVNQPYINLRDAGELRNQIDSYLAVGFPGMSLSLIHICRCRRAI